MPLNTKKNRFIIFLVIKMKILDYKFGKVLTVGAVIFFVLAFVSVFYIFSNSLQTVEYIFGLELLEFSFKELAITFVASFLTYSAEEKEIKK